jgi:FkbM family methyltransferase
MAEDDVWSALRRISRYIECRTIFDVGAHQGGLTKWFLEVFPDSTIYAFEPDPRNFGPLSRNAETQPRVHPFQIALSNKAGLTDFHLGAADYTSSLFPRAKNDRRYFPKDFTMLGTEKVVTDTLDGFCANRIDQIDILKMDTQGAELDILRGSTGLLSSGSIFIIVSEFFFIPHYEGAPLLNEIWTHLHTFSYELFDLCKGPYGSNGQIRYGDAIFVSPQFRCEFLNSEPDEP